MLKRYFSNTLLLLSRSKIRHVQPVIQYSEKHQFPKPNKATRDFNYCVEVVKSNDYEAYLTTLISPEEIMQPAFVIKAFNIELLSIGRSAREPKISEIKLQFWKEQVDKLYNEESALLKMSEAFNLHSAEPIASQLKSVVKKFNINKTWLNRLVDGRRLFLKSQFRTVEDLEKCADMSNAYYILFNCMGLKNVDCDHAANHLAKAQLLCALTKNLFKKPGQVVFYLPIDMLAKHKISQQDLVNFSERVLRPKQQNFKDLAFDLCSRANEHLRCARNLKDKIPKNAKRLLISSVGCDVFLERVQKCDFDMMDPRLNSDFRTKFLVRLLLAKFRNIY